MKLKIPIATPAPPAIKSGSLVSSACSTLLTTMPATIHPIVPNTRISGNCFSWLVRLWNASVLVSPIVGM